MKGFPKMHGRVGTGGRGRAGATPPEIGGRVVVGLEGPALTARETALIRKIRPVGFILFRRNIVSASQVRALTARLRALTAEASGPVPPLLAIDHEGWPVHRLEGIATLFPGCLMLGSAGSARLAREQGLCMGRELAGLGLNVDFAPVLDRFKRRSHPVVALRSLGSGVAGVERLGLALMEGLQAGGVLACPKHLPGIGGCVVDPHVGLPRIPWPRDGKKFSADLRPFQAAVGRGARLLMAGHVLAGFGPDGRQELSTCSRALLHGLLRTRMGFGGVLITDDMHMGALTLSLPLHEACLKTLEAGADLLLLCRPLGEQAGLLAQLQARLVCGTPAGWTASGRRVLELRKHLAVLEAATRSGNGEEAADPARLLETLCRRGLRPVRGKVRPPRQVREIAMLVLHPRGVTFPGARRIRWDAFARGLREAACGVPVRVTGLPVSAVERWGPRMERLREKILSGGAGRLLVICCDGVVCRDLVQDLIDRLAARLPTAVVSVAADAQLDRRLPGLCARLAANGGDAGTLRLSAAALWNIL